MSHKIIVQTEISDKVLAIEALKLAGCVYQDLGEVIQITSGPMKGAKLDLTTATVTGDSDFKHTKSNNSLGLIKRYYAEAKYMKESKLAGHEVVQREVLKDGRVKLHCRGNL